MDTSLQGLVERHATEMQAAFATVVDALVKGSKVNIWCLRITNVTEETFSISLEGEVTNAGPARATIAPFAVDLCDGAEFPFAKLKLKQIDVRNGKGNIAISNQQVDVVDRAVLVRWIRHIMTSERAVVLLRRGNTTLRALGIGPRAVMLEKKVFLTGMNGPAVSVASVTPGGGFGFGMSFSSATITIPEDSERNSTPNRINSSPSMYLGSNSNSPMPSSSTSATLAAVGSKMGFVLHVENPSPVEISFGTCSFEIRAIPSPSASTTYTSRATSTTVSVSAPTEGRPPSRLLAELKGRLSLRRNHFEVKFQGTVNTNLAARVAAEIQDNRNRNDYTEVRLVGKRCAAAGWCDDTIKSIDVPLKNFNRIFRALSLEGFETEPEGDGEAAEEEETAQREPMLSRWARRLSLR